MLNIGETLHWPFCGELYIGSCNLFHVKMSLRMREAAETPPRNYQFHRWEHTSPGWNPFQIIACFGWVYIQQEVEKIEHLVADSSASLRLACASHCKRKKNKEEPTKCQLRPSSCKTCVWDNDNDKNNDYH